MLKTQSSKAGTKEIANSLLAEAQRARRRGGTAKQPFSHGGTEDHGDTEKHPRQKNQIPTAHGETSSLLSFQSVLSFLRVSVLLRENGCFMKFYALRRRKKMLGKFGAILGRVVVAAGAIEHVRWTGQAFIGHSADDLAVAENQIVSVGTDL